MATKINYPIPRKDDSISEDLHGHVIKDPYRWLEDPDSKETEAFVNAQNEISRPFLEGEQWQKLKEKLKSLWNYPKFSCPARHGEYYYSYNNTGLQNQHVLYQSESFKDEAGSKVFLDPNTLSDDGTTSLSQTEFSENGNFMAYALSESGSDWNRIKIRKVDSGKDFPETLEKVKFTSISWTKDEVGFFYSRYPDQDGKTDGSETKQNRDQKLYYHRIGEPQEKDVLVVEFPQEPSWRISAKVSHCGRYLVLFIVKDGRENLLFFVDLIAAGKINGLLEYKKIVHKFEADYDYVTNTDSHFILQTNKNAPNYRLIVIDFNNPEEENWKTLVKEHETDVLEWAKCVNNDKLIIAYIHDVKSVLGLYSLVTGDFIQGFPLDVGQVLYVSGEKHHSEIFFYFVSFLNPGTIYYFDFDKPQKMPEAIRDINIEGFKKDDYKVEQLFYKSKDGTKIPMFLVRKAAVNLEPRPCLLYGYGGFNVSLLPSFSILNLMFINTFDGILAIPNIRGGGEYGEKWHNAGRLLNKQNGFDDFQSAAEYLIDKNYTTKQQLVINGASNGGLLVGACINQRPELYGAAIAQVGVLDMLRFHKFTIGHAWCSDYGNPDEKENFEYLLKYSPLHNVHTPKLEKQQYPSTLILTADHDDRVSPLHSLKFAAAAQEAVRESLYQTNPILLRVYKKAGHGAGKPTTKKIEEQADILAFITKALKVSTINV